MPLEGLSFVKALAKFGIIYATDPPLQNVTKIVCLRLLTFDTFIHKYNYTVLNYVRQFFKIRKLSTRFISASMKSRIFIYFLFELLLINFIVVR